MWRGSISESIGVECEVGRIQPNVSEILLQDLYPVLSCSSAGHLVPTEVQVESATQLTSSGTILSLLVVDVEGLHRHGPSRDEVEARVLGCDDVAMVTLYVVTPLDFSAS